MGIPALHFMEQGNQNSGPGCTNRMPQCNRAAVYIDLRHIPTHFGIHGASLRSKRFVDFHQVEVLGGPACPLETTAAGRNRTDPHHGRVDASGCKRLDLGQRLQTQRARALRRHHNQRSRTIIDAGRIGGGHCSVLFESWFQTADGLCRRPGLDVLIGSEFNRRTFTLCNGDRHNFVVEPAR